MIINRGTKDSIGGLTLPEFMKGEELLKEFRSLRKEHRARRLNETLSIRVLKLKNYLREALKDFCGVKANDQKSRIIFAANARAIKLTSPLPHLRSAIPSTPRYNHYRGITVV